MTDGGDCNIPDTFLKKRGDKDSLKDCFENVNIVGYTVENLVLQ